MVNGSFTNSHIECSFSQKKPLFFLAQDLFGPIFGFLGGNNSRIQCLIELKFWSQVVLIVVRMPFKAFWRTQIFTVTRLTKVWVFGPTLTLIYPLKLAKIKNNYQVIQISQNQRPNSFQFSIKTVINFCAIWAFSGTNGLMVKDQVVTGQVRTAFWKYPLLRASCGNFGRSSFKK